MGTKVQCESYYSGYSSMRDLNDDSNSCSWPLYHGDKTFTNGQYYNSFLPCASVDAYPGYDKDVVRHTMLEHEAIFKNQLYELHRLYRIQRDLMDEVRMKQVHQNRMVGETSMSSSHLASQVSCEDAQKWQISSFPWANPSCARLSTSGFKDIPICSTKGSSSRASPVHSQNGCSSKDLEILELKPTKLRKKIDLRLPADEYIDNEEDEQDRDGGSSHPRNRNCNAAPESGINMFLGDSQRNHLQGETLLPDSFSQNSRNVDLNEPIDIEETDASACVDLRGHEPYAEQKSRIMGLPYEVSLSSYHRSDNGTLSNPQFLHNGHGNNWFSRLLDPGHNKNRQRSVSQAQQSEKQAIAFHPMHALFNKPIDSSTLSTADPREVHLLRESSVCGLQLSDRQHGNSLLESVSDSHMFSPYLISSSSFPKPGSHSAASWEKPVCSSGKGATANQQHLPFNSSTTLSRSSQSATQSHGFFVDRQKHNHNSISNPSFGDRMPYRNGFYHGSSSQSKELVAPAPTCDYERLSYSSMNNAASERLMSHIPGKSINRGIDLNGSKDCNLNGFLSNSSSNKAAPGKAPKVIDLEGTHEDHLVVTLPWLKAKPICKNEHSDAVIDLNSVDSGFSQSSLSHLSHKKETTPYLTDFQNMKSASYSNVEVSRIDVNDSLSCRKILGCPIFEKHHVPKNESSSSTSPCVPPLQASVVELDNKKENRVVDINLPCELAVPDFCQSTPEFDVTKKEADAKASNFRREIDLNTSMNEDEESLAPYALGSNRKTTGIDLEAPAPPEGDEDVVSSELCPVKTNETTFQLPCDEADSHQNELVRTAAEAIVALTASAPQYHNDAICDQGEASMIDSLSWFADIAFSCGGDLSNELDAVLGSKDGEDHESFSEEIDYFESMTLKLVDTKKEDYMPEPLVPENLNLEEAPTSALPTRTRRGPPRRGRQRRDFQRDILPGLASLSRHEVTEDIQTFDGLMRITGHSWHSGLTRRSLTRKGGGRGRRRSVISSPSAATTNPPCTPLIQKLYNIETGLEDQSLTRWGKTTRRPRRQRCAAGNPAPIPLT